jgi:uncharacterized protein YprB with RNaseH-like and TPR domain
MLIGFDIETDTSGVCPDGERTGLDPRYTRIISAAVWSDVDREFFADEAEQKLLRNINEYFMDVRDKSSTILTWNGSQFDWPSYLTRAQCNGVATGISWRISPDRPPKYRTCPGYDGGLVISYGGLDHVDLMYPYKAYAEKHDIKQSLKPVTTHLGLNPIEVDATQMELLSDEELREYNLSDVRVTYEAGQFIDLDPWRDSVAA